MHFEPVLQIPELRGLPLMTKGKSKAQILAVGQLKNEPKKGGEPQPD